MESDGASSEAAQIAEWSASALGLEVEVEAVRKPGHGGMSGDTRLVMLKPGGEGSLSGMVLKIAGGNDLFPPEFQDYEYESLAWVGAHTQAPVPRLLGREADPAWLGAPFIATELVAGQVPPDRPIYHRRGWMAEAAPADQQRVWWSGLEAMAKVHVVPVGDTDAPALPGGSDAAAIAAHVDWWEGYMGWAAPDGCEIAAEGIAWLRERIPSGPAPVPVISWGDSRLGNILFDGFQCRALLDWEMSRIGRAEDDLGYWLFHDRHHSEGLGLERMASLPSREETIARYEQLIGRPLEDLRFDEVFAALRLGLITVRMIDLIREKDPVAARLLEKIPPLTMLREMIS